MHASDAAKKPHDPAPSGAGRFAFRADVFDTDDLRRAVTRIAHEIVERNHGAGDLVLVGLYTRGVALSRRLARSVDGDVSAESGLGGRFVVLLPSGLTVTLTAGESLAPDVPSPV